MDLLKKQNRDIGFTLIELLIVISIIGIIAAIAIPQFSSYRARASTTEGLILAAEVKEGIVDFYRHTGRFPANNAEAGLPAAEHIRGKYVGSITVSNGAIDIRFNDRNQYALEWEVLTIRPAVSKDNPTGPVLWVMGNKDAPSSMEVFGEDLSKKKTYRTPDKVD